MESLLAAHEELDFRAQLWPLIAKDAGYAYYRELFTGYPERVRGSWDEFSARFDVLDWYSREREDLVAAAIPDPILRLDLEALLDQPFSGCAPSRTMPPCRDQWRDTSNTTSASARVRTTLKPWPCSRPCSASTWNSAGWSPKSGSIRDPNKRYTGGGTASSVSWIPGRRRTAWREILALHRAGLLQFLGPGMWVRPDEASGRFVAGSFQSPVVVDATAYIEARLPAPSVARSANPALTDLHDAGWGTEQSLLTSDGPHSHR